MSETYKAIEVQKPGEFAEVRRPRQDPGRDLVRIGVEACGVCHPDAVPTDAKSMLIAPPDVAIEHLFPPFSPEKTMISDLERVTSEDHDRDDPFDARRAVHLRNAAHHIDPKRPDQIEEFIWQ